MIRDDSWALDFPRSCPALRHRRSPRPASDLSVCGRCCLAAANERWRRRVCVVPSVSGTLIKVKQVAGGSSLLGTTYAISYTSVPHICCTTTSRQVSDCSARRTLALSSSAAVAAVSVAPFPIYQSVNQIVIASPDSNTAPYHPGHITNTTSRVLSSHTLLAASLASRSKSPCTSYLLYCLLGSLAAVPLPASTPVPS